MKVLIIIFLVIISSCDKQTYCVECTNGVQHIEFCNCTMDDVNQVIDYWENRQGDWKCTVK